MRLMFRKHQWGDKTLTGLTRHTHPERGTVSVAVGEGPASAPSLPPTSALRRMKEQFLRSVSPSSSAKVFQCNTVWKRIWRPRASSVSCGISCHRGHQGLCSGVLLCVSLCPHLSELGQPVSASPWGCWVTGWNWEAVCSQIVPCLYWVVEEYKHMPQRMHPLPKGHK